MPSASPSKSPAVFFDRDGTLMEEVHYCREAEKVRAFPGVGEALARLRQAGFRTIIVTNQSGIGRGLIQMAAYEAVQKELLRQLGDQIDATYFCADAPEVASSRRKPGTGMVEEALRDHPLQVEGSWFVGDKEADLQCGRAAGLQTILVQTGYGRQTDPTLADHVAADVVKAIIWILEHAASKSA